VRRRRLPRAEPPPGDRRAGPRACRPRDARLASGVAPPFAPAHRAAPTPRERTPMYMFVVALHVLLCLFLILIILLQPGKGGDVGAAFGGGSSSAVFGPRGPGNLLQRATTVVAVLFMCTSVTLALYSNRSNLSNANVEGALQQLQ